MDSMETFHYFFFSINFFSKGIDVIVIVVIVVVVVVVVTFYAALSQVM